LFHTLNSQNTLRVEVNDNLSTPSPEPFKVSFKNKIVTNLKTPKQTIPQMQWLTLMTLSQQT